MLLKIGLFLFHCHPKIYHKHNNSFQFITSNSKLISSHAKCGTLAPGLKELFRKLTSICPSSRSVVFTLLAEQRSLIIFELVMADNFIKCVSGYLQFFELYPALITVKNELEKNVSIDTLYFFTTPRQNGNE